MNLSLQQLPPGSLFSLFRRCYNGACLSMNTAFLSVEPNLSMPM